MSLQSIFRCRHLLSVMVAGAAMVLAAANADAGNITLQFEHNGAFVNVVGTPTSLVLGPTAIGTDFVISGAISASNFDGESTGAELDLNTLKVERVGASSAAALFIRVVLSDFLEPVGDPLFLQNTSSADFSANSAGNTVTFQSFFDPSDSGVFGAGQPTDPITLLPDLDPTTVNSDSGSAPFETVNRTTTTSEFSLSSIFSVDLLHVGDNANVQGKTFVTNTPPGITAVPEPSSLLLLGLGGLGFAAARRRRRAA